MIIPACISIDVCPQHGRRAAAIQSFRNMRALAHRNTTFVLSLLDAMIALRSIRALVTNELVLLLTKAGRNLASTIFTTTNKILHRTK